VTRLVVAVDRGGVRVEKLKGKWRAEASKRQTEKLSCSAN
jgi:hypothetical protein